MIIEQYLHKMKTLCVAENRNKDSVNAALEDFIRSSSLKNSQSYFRFEMLFQKADDKFISLNFETLQYIANCCGLLFLEDQATGNVCFAHSQELRPEFKQSCTAIDILDFTYAIMHSSFYNKDSKIEEVKIPIPQDAAVFWKLVQIGKELRTTEK